MKSCSLVFALLMLTATACAEDALSCAYAPGWQPSGVQRTYTADNLFDYKDGAAESYLAFGFTRMTGIDCKRGNETLSIDISEMTDADSAYGIFTANRDPNLPLAAIGMGAQIQKQSAAFAKGSYFVELVIVAPSPDTDESATLQPFVAALAQRLSGSTTLPETLSWFPKENLVSAGLVPESLLGLRILKRGYVAHYKQGQAFILHEASPQAAAAILQQLRARFAPVTEVKVADEAFVVKAPYLGGLCVFRKGAYLAGYANLPDTDAAQTLALGLAAHIP